MPRTSKYPQKPEQFSYRYYEALSNFITERAKILPSKRSGLTSKEQRQLARAIKHARHLGLLPFKAKV